MRTISVFAAVTALLLANSAGAADDPALIERLRAPLAGLLRDPSSAQIQIKKGPWQDAALLDGQSIDGQFICAEINAKNAYGAYTGFKPYMFVIYADDGRVGVFERGRSLGASEVLTEAKCGPIRP